MTSQSAEDTLPPPPPPSSSCGPYTRFRRPLATDVDNVEDVELYRHGGHHPVNLGNVLGHRFKILHKLGHGGFALVWLARDLEQHRCVALKILRADAPDREIKILTHLKDATRKAPIAHLHETFTIHGPNGVHQCLVLDLGGPNLKHLSFKCKRPPLPFLKAASRKLAEGLAAIHSVGVCHGDLTHTNVLFEIPGVHDWTEELIYQYLGAPKAAPLLLLQGMPAPGYAPAHIVNALKYAHLGIEQLSSNVLITDFGEAFFHNNVPKGLGTPAFFSAPELLFGYPPSVAIDLWALGCLIFEIHTFRTLMLTGFGSYQEGVGMAIETLGALPQAWYDLYYDKDNPMYKRKPGVKNRWYDNSIERSYTLGGISCC